jgi:hypothetical protein
MQRRLRDRSTEGVEDSPATGADVHEVSTEDGVVAFCRFWNTVPKHVYG